MSKRKIFGIKKSTKPPASVTKFSLAEIKRLCSTPIMRRCLAGQDFTASDLKDEVMAFAVYRRSNAIG